MTARSRKHTFALTTFSVSGMAVLRPSELRCDRNHDIRIQDRQTSIPRQCSSRWQKQYTVAVAAMLSAIGGNALFHNSADRGTQAVDPITIAKFGNTFVSVASAIAER
jgi:hypothetical protein